MSKKYSLPIKEWATDDRPREKLLKKGIRSLSNAELIAIIIRSGTTNKSAVELAKLILQSVDNDLDTLGKKSTEELINSFKGIGIAKAVSIIAALEIGKRRNLSLKIEKKKITASKDVFDIFNPLLCDLPYEEFWILLTNRSNKVIDSIKISQGGINATIVDVRLILKIAIERLASGIILCHNHPSGNINPGDNDKTITQKINKAVQLVDINLLDHIIVANDKYYSFADEGILKK